MVHESLRARKMLKPDCIIEFENCSRLDEPAANPEGLCPSPTLVASIDRQSLFVSISVSASPLFFSPTLSSPLYFLDPLRHVPLPSLPYSFSLTLSPYFFPLSLSLSLCISLFSPFLFSIPFISFHSLFSNSSGKGTFP